MPEKIPKNSDYASTVLAEPYVNQAHNGESFDSSTNDGVGTQSEEQLRPTVELLYVLCNHTPENAAEVVEAVIGYDIVAFENVGLGRIGRGMVRKLSNRQTKGKGGAYAYDDNFFAQVITGLQGTGVQVELIDVAKSDKAEYKATQASLAEEERFTQSLYTRPSKELLDDYQRDLSLVAASNIAREAVVEKQVQHLVSQQRSSAKIAIIQGADHSSNSRTTIDAAGIDVRQDRVWIDEMPRVVFNKYDTKFAFSGHSNLVRKIMMSPEKQLDNLELRHGILQLYLYDYLTSNGDGVVELEVKQSLADELINQMDDLVQSSDSQEINRQKVFHMIRSSQLIRRFVPRSK